MCDYKLIKRFEGLSIFEGLCLWVRPNISDGCNLKLPPQINLFPEQLRTQVFTKRESYDFSAEDALQGRITAGDVLKALAQSAGKRPVATDTDQAIADRLACFFTLLADGKIFAKYTMSYTAMRTAQIIVGSNSDSFLPISQTVPLGIWDAPTGTEYITRDSELWRGEARLYSSLTLTLPRVVSATKWPEVDPPHLIYNRNAKKLVEKHISELRACGEELQSYTKEIYLAAFFNRCPGCKGKIKPETIWGQFSKQRKPE